MQNMNAKLTVYLFLSRGIMMWSSMIMRKPNLCSGTQRSQFLRKVIW